MIDDYQWFKMASFIPLYPSDFNNSLGEQEVYESLAKLDDRIYIFHSLRWTGSEKSRDGQGEADFVVFDPEQGIMILEVKSGIMEWSSRQWTQTNRKTGQSRTIFDPEAQANRSKFAILELIKNDKVLPANCECRVCHAVWFPSHPVARDCLPPNIKPDMMLDQTDLVNPDRAIDRAFAFWATKYPHKTLLKNQIDSVLRAIAPVFKSALSLKGKYQDIYRRMIAMTDQQVAVLNFLDLQKRAAIIGSAGTGKTVIALEKARRLAANGDLTLLLCFNRALKEHLARIESNSSVIVENFHGLMAKIHESDDMSLDAKVETSLEALLDGHIPWPYKHVIVDEGQDFKNLWIETMETLTSGVFYVFSDPNQSVQRKKMPTWIEQSPCRLQLTKNCRNTYAIQRTAYRSIRLALMDKRKDHGSRVKLHGPESNEKSLSIIRKLTKRQSDIFGDDMDVAILTINTEKNSLLTGCVEIAGTPLGDPNEEGSLRFSSIRRFKGLEATCVILIDVDPRRFVDETYKRLFYVGSSRAVAELHVILSDASKEAIAEGVSALAPNRKIKKNKKGLERILACSWEDSTEEGKNV